MAGSERRRARGTHVEWRRAAGAPSRRLATLRHLALTQSSRISPGWCLGRVTRDAGEKVFGGATSQRHRDSLFNMALIKGVLGVIPFAFRRASAANLRDDHKAFLICYSRK